MRTGVLVVSVSALCGLLLVVSRHGTAWMLPLLALPMPALVAATQTTLTAVVLLALALAGVGGLVLRRRLRTQRHHAYATGVAAGSVSGRAATLNEVRAYAHAHLKSVILATQHQLRDLERTALTAQQHQIYTGVVANLDELYAEIVRVHATIADAVDPSDTVLPSDLEHALIEVVKKYDMLIDGCRLEIEGMPHAPVARPIRSALELTLYNALTNAHVHGRATDVQVRVQFGLDQIALTVSDNGCGFDVAAQRRRATGRGLHDLDSTAQQHNGSIAVHSTLGRGTTVTLTVPVPPPPGGLATLPAALRAAPTGGVSHQHAPYERNDG